MIELSSFKVYDSSYGSVCYVGDLHLHWDTPRSRIDDYPQTCLNKLKSLLNICIANHVKILIFEGDVFHSATQPLEYISRVAQTLLEFSIAGIELYTIIGNHDVKNGLLQNIEKSALGILLLTGVIKPLGKIIIMSERGSVGIYGTHFGQDIQAPDMEDITCCVAHRFYESGFGNDKENLTKAELLKLPYDRYFLGHDHVVYPTLYEEGRTIYRVGSFTRGTAHLSNLDRKPQVLIQNYNDGTEVLKEIPCLEASVVFSATVVENKGLKDLYQAVTDTFEQLVTRLDAKETVVSVYSVLDTLDLKPQVKNRVEEYLTLKGIFRNRRN